MTQLWGSDGERDPARNTHEKRGLWKHRVPYLRGAARREALIGDRRGGRLVGRGASITAVLLERGLQNNTQLKSGQRAASANTHRWSAGETALFTPCVGRQDYTRSQNGGRALGQPQGGDRHGWEHFLPLLTRARFKINSRNQVSQGFRAKKSWEPGIIQKECRSCFSSSASPTSVSSGILLCLQLCDQHGAGDNT